MTTKTYDAFTYGEGKPIIGEARQEKDGILCLNLWLVPRQGLIYLKPRKEKGKA